MAHKITSGCRPVPSGGVPTVCCSPVFGSGKICLLPHPWERKTYSVRVITSLDGVNVAPEDTESFTWDPYFVGVRIGGRETTVTHPTGWTTGHRDYGDEIEDFAHPIQSVLTEWEEWFIMPAGSEARPRIKIAAGSIRQGSPPEGDQNRHWQWAHHLHVKGFNVYPNGLEQETSFSEEMTDEGVRTRGNNNGELFFTMDWYQCRLRFELTTTGWLVGNTNTVSVSLEA